jgi:hypothetical protein
MEGIVATKIDGRSRWFRGERGPERLWHAVSTVRVCLIVCTVRVLGLAAWWLQRLGAG